MENMITIKNLNFSYPDGHQALTDINLEIGRGEIFGIIGPTGAGKSTFLQHLNGILKGRGDVLIDNLRSDKKNDAKIKEKVGIVFQNPEDQLFCPTVFEDIAFGLFNLGLKKDEVHTRVDDILKTMDLFPLKHLSSHHLSFGEKKRVALATVLVMNPMVLALDEPFANLDYKNIMNVIEIIKKLAITRVIISQDILLSLSLCERVAVLEHGRIVKVATPSEIVADTDLLVRTGLDYRGYLEVIGRLIKN